MSDLFVTQNLKWIGQVQPEGLVVSAHTLADAELVPTPDTIALQRRFLEHWEDDNKGLRDPVAFLSDFLGWPDAFLVRGDAIPDDLRVTLENFGDSLEPTLALRTNPRDADAAKAPWLALVREEVAGTDFDAVHQGSGWQASPHARLERLLRETQVPIGILISPQLLRLVYAPRGENAGHLTFRFEDLSTNAGRTLLAALELLLGQTRLWAAPTKKRLSHLLRASRESQARVSAELSQQVLASLYELLRGFAQADQQANRQLLSDLVARDPQNVYQGLLTVLLRLVFLLYAEDRGLMPQTDLYQRNYSVHGLWARLRDDAQQHQDTMDRRFGAWAQLLSLFRLVYGGCRHPDLKLPARLGHLFDPTRFPFLEGPEGSVPLVPDRTLFTVLDNLLVLAGEKLSYRTLDVEQIGSVYESIMGFTLQTVQGLSIALKPAKKHGAPPVLDLDALLAVAPAKRDEFVKNATDRKLSAKLAGELKAARTVDELLAVFRDLQDVRATPSPVPPGGWILAPTEERRKSGSHYTPRSLSAPVVEKALKPVWLRLGLNPTPEAIQDLRICDPAMGSGAFLVETCRQLAERLVESWKAHGAMPEIPPDEDELLYARRVVAQRCLYGVDRNPMAVDLAKLSLWLATLAKDHPFTFLDHSLRAGDSLVGLSRDQAVAFHWDPEADPAFGSYELDARLVRVQSYRLRILQGNDQLPPAHKAEQLRLADSELQVVREAADLTLSAFFSSDKPKLREAARKQAAVDWKGVRSEPLLLQKLARQIATLQSGPVSVSPFHWELEFPEVFFPGLARNDRKKAGFDAMVGNPPFVGGSKISSISGANYLDWLLTNHPGSHGNGDLAAHFFRRCFSLVRDGGSFGLIATNTIAQGDTRSTGLRYLRKNDGLIYDAVRRVKWPGEAAVVVSTVHVVKSPVVPLVEALETSGTGSSPRTSGSSTLAPQVSRASTSGATTALPILLDGKPVEKITAFLFHDGGDETPAVLKRNANKSFLGSKVYGQGFVFDSSDVEATPLSEMERLIAANPRNQERIFPYIGGEEVNDSPTHAHHRYVINFGEMPLCRQSQASRWAPDGGAGIVSDDFEGPVAADWPDLLTIVETKVKPSRLAQNREIRARYWWRFGETTPALFEALQGKERVLANSQVSSHVVFGVIPAGQVFAHTLNIYPGSSFGQLVIMQSRLHEIWVRTLGSSLEERFRYTPSDCFETFPFPPNGETDPVLEHVGREYHDFRAALMVRHNEGLTKTYNRFHDPDHDGTGIDGIDPAQVMRDIDELRRLHSELDKAVLAAYGWTDIDPTCEFLLDYEDEEDEDAPRAGKGRKKPWRLRFPDSVRDDILARLLKLNAQYAREEGQEQAPTPRFAARPQPESVATAPKPAAKPRKPKSGNEAQERLL